MVTPSAAVTTVLIALSPTDKLMGGDAVPEATGAPFTVMLAASSADTGVIVMDVTALDTLVV